MSVEPQSEPLALWWSRNLRPKEKEVLGWRGLCKRCHKLKSAPEFKTPTGRVCIECSTELVRDDLGRFVKLTRREK